MKAIKILIFTILFVLIIGAVTVALIYFYTDTFKPNQEIFYKYTSEEQAEKIINAQSIKDLIDKIQTENNEQNIKITVNSSKGNKILIDSQNVNIVNKVDNENKRIQSTMTFGDDINENIISLALVRNEEAIFDDTSKDIYAFVINDIIDDQYVGIENKNLKKFVQKLGFDNSNVENKIEIKKYLNDLEKKDPGIDNEMKELYNLFKDNTDKTNYSKIGKTEITLNGTNTEANGYELNIKGNQLKDILEKSNSEFFSQLDSDKFNLYVRIYLQNKKLVKCEASLEDTQRTLSINISREENNLYIKYYKENEIDFVLNVTVNGSLDSNQISYVGSVSYNLLDKNINTKIDFDASFVFNEVIDTVILTDENSVILNNYEADKVLNVISFVIENINNVEGIEETVLGKYLESKSDIINEIAEATNRANTEEVQQFNSRFTEYQGQTTGINIKSLITIVETSNSTSDIKVVLKEDGEEKTGSRIMSTIDNDTSYNVTFEYDETGYISIINIAK